MTSENILKDYELAKKNKRQDIVKDLEKKHPGVLGLKKKEEPKEEPQEEKNVLEKIAENKKKGKKIPRLLLRFTQNALGMTNTLFQLVIPNCQFVINYIFLRYCPPTSNRASLI